jgi:hypothetical protein
MLFRPVWADVIVVISEAIARLPVWAMHGYADFVLEHMKPIKSANLCLLPSQALLSKKI